MASKGSNTGLVALMALAAAVAGALVAYVRTTPAADKVPPDIRRIEPGQSQPVEAQNSEVKVYIPRAKGMDTIWDAQTTTVPKREDARVFAVNSFLRSTTITNSDARLLNVDIHAGVADLHFNPAFNESVGTGDEKTLLDGIRLSLGQFSDIQKIAFFSDGQKMLTLGNVDLAEPLNVLTSPNELSKGEDTEKQQ